MRRREFVGSVLLGGAAGRAAGPQGPADGGGEERMTWPTGDGYEAPVATAENEVRWVQVDLGSTRKIDAVKLYPQIILAGQRPGNLLGRRRKKPQFGVIPRVVV